MLQKLQKNRESGFTIVEVLIVLAIAALILLIVFLAVPALERNTRNTGRKEDAGRIATAVANYVGNNQGTLPTTVAQLTSIYSDAGSLNQFNNLTPSATAPAVNATGIAAGIYLSTLQYGGAQTTQSNVVIVDTPTAAATQGYQCGTNGAVNTGGAPTDSVVLFSLEVGSGNWNWGCVDAT